MSSTYAELHSHTNFSFLHGASPVEDMAERAAALGLSGLAVTDHDGLYGVVRFATAAEAVGLRPIIGIEIELQDAAAPDPDGIVLPARRRLRGRGPAPGPPGPITGLASEAIEGMPARPRPARARLPGHRHVVKEDLRGIGERQRGPHLVLLARDATGYRSLCRLVSRANLDGTKRVPRFTQALLARHTEGLLALSGGREGEIARRLRVGDRDGARAVAARYTSLFGGAGTARGRGGESPATAGFFVELSHHLLLDDDWLVSEHVVLADELGLPVVVTNDVHYARPEDRELHDVLTCIFHGRALDTLGDLRRPDGESYLKSAAELAALPPADAGTSDGHAGTSDGHAGTSSARIASAWAEGIATSGEIAATCTVDLGFEQYRFPGFPVPNGETAFSYLSELCWTGARKRYHPLSSAVVNRLAHELDVIERAGLAEFFLICWDLMRFAKEQGIPAQGRGSATSSIVSYTLGISRVEPIQHNLLFERFINEGRTTYPDVDIDFSSERREEVIQYVYGRYGPEHTGMVCNLVTYRARSAVREVGYALGFPRPLVDRVAKALETYDSVMVRRDLEADGGFAEFFRRPGEGLPPETAAADDAEARGLVDGMGQLNTRVPLVGKVPPWRQPPKPVDPNAPRPFAWLHAPVGADAWAAIGADHAEATDATPAAAGLGQIPPPEVVGALGDSHGRIQASADLEFIPAQTWDRTVAGVDAPLESEEGASSLPSTPPGGIWQVGTSVGPSASGMWEGAPESPPSIRPGGRADDEGGPGDTPASVAWLRAGRGTGYRRTSEALLPPATVVATGRELDPESGMPAPPDRSTDRSTDRLGRPNHWAGVNMGTPGAGAAAAALGSGATDGNIRGGIGVDRLGRADPHSSVARIEPEQGPQARGGSTVGMSAAPGSTASRGTCRSTRAGCS
ncbi:MAG: PHP domain-containing protein [Chloroflexi bacterium]|nr:MAG: PHP domain-containing protein [Chloroflexota bacterium]